VKRGGQGQPRDSHQRNTEYKKLKMDNYWKKGKMRMSLLFGDKKGSALRALRGGGGGGVIRKGKQGGGGGFGCD